VDESRQACTRNAYRTIIDHLPMPVFIVDDDVRIHMHNNAARSLLPPDPSVVYRTRFGEALDCIHSADGCGRGEHCHECPIRSSVKISGSDVDVCRLHSELELHGAGTARTLTVLVTTSPIVFDDGALYVVVLEDVTELTRLRKLVPICADCKSVRCADGSWHSIEEFMSESMHTSLTHGLCPACAERTRREIRGPGSSA